MQKKVQTKSLNSFKNKFTDSLSKQNTTPYTTNSIQLKYTLFTMILFQCISSFSQQNTNDLYKIIEYGSYAPSSHNAQMWNIRLLGENKIEVFPNSERTLSSVDPKNRETWISIGAFVKNCEIAATDLGYKSEIKINEKSVIIGFEKAPNIVKSNNNIELIKKRLTIRTPFLKKAINDTVVSHLTNTSDNILYFKRNSSDGTKIIDYSLKAYQLQMQDTAKLKELANWMTFSYKEEKQRKDGMTPKALGVTGVKHFFFNLFMNKKSVTKKVFIKGSVKGAKKQLNSCAGYILITSKSSSNIDLVKTGMNLEEVWLACIHNKIAVQPMSQVLEEQKYYDLLKSSLGITEEIQMLLRVGKVKKYPVETKKRRLDIKHIIVN
ncbi:nitroreductase family protein [Tenacibaculum sp. UWU-22]|uniref:Acg family FMN-binding oxidoreductase n=1 Tax=Tenacibaculum sp. UWU-22 TaxID=3234187 RepID=UPI0034DB513A